MPFGLTAEAVLLPLGEGLVAVVGGVGVGVVVVVVVVGIVVMEGVGWLSSGSSTGMDGWGLRSAVVIGVLVDWESLPCSGG